ncbi:MAG: hypothetical protein SPK35_01725 [Prevotella sp.]|nr:hypothetical protein [Prevotella sp.]
MSEDKPSASLHSRYQQKNVFSLAFWQKIRNFALKIKSFLKMNTLTREEAMRRFMAAKQKKQACVERMTKELSSICEQRTGKKIEEVFVL